MQITWIQLHRIENLIRRIACSQNQSSKKSEIRVRTAQKRLKIYVDKLGRERINAAMQRTGRFTTI